MGSASGESRVDRTAAWCRLVVALSAVFLVAACAGPGDLTRHTEITGGQTAGWELRRFPQGPFVLSALLKAPPGASETLVVYIEGDGRAWRYGRTPPRDPTPLSPLALKLAARDPRPAVLYLARPCQYTAPGSTCASRYWSSHRFAAEVVAAVNGAVGAAMAELGARRVELIGYSGGGVVAALVAARRTDVSRLMTVASPLDHAAWTRFHEVSPLAGSLDPVPLAGLPQRHFVGAEDPIVPPRLVADFLGGRDNLVTIAGFGHDCCWVDAWPGLLAGAP